MPGKNKKYVTEMPPEYAIHRENAKKFIGKVTYLWMGILVTIIVLRLAGDTSIVPGHTTTHNGFYWAMVGIAMIIGISCQLFNLAIRRNEKKEKEMRDNRPY